MLMSSLVSALAIHASGWLAIFLVRDVASFSIWHAPLPAQAGMLVAHYFYGW